MDGQYSDYFDIEQGVAQGCPLSPILFIIFMNDLLVKLHTTCGANGLKVQSDGRPFVGSSFADDTFALGTDERQLRRIIAVMQQHSQDWCWDANVLKSHILKWNHTECDNEQFEWKGAAIPMRKEAKNLGLRITDDLSWVKQIRAAKSNVMNSSLHRSE